MRILKADGTKIFRFLNACGNVNDRMDVDEMTQGQAKSVLKDLEKVHKSIPDAGLVLRKIARGNYTLSGTSKRKTRKVAIKPARKTAKVNIFKLAGRGGGIHVLVNGNEHDFDRHYTLEDILQFYKPEYHSAIKRVWNKTEWVDG
jgi:hypothetical protein